MDPNKKQVKIALLLVSSLTIMSMITISASLPDMAAHFSQHIHAQKLAKLTLSFPALFIALSAMIAGIFIDKFGRLKLLGVALLFFAVSAFWMFKPTSSVFKKGLYFTLGGIVLTVVLLFV